MKNDNGEQKYFESFVDSKIPKHLQSGYIQLIGAMKAAFYEGIKFARLSSKKDGKSS